MTTVDVVVAGAGCAGLAAATALAQAGVRVAVIEARPVLGGRTFATRDQTTGEWVDNGQHVLLGCYHDTLAFTRRIGAGRLLAVQSALRVPMVDEAGVESELRSPALPSPLHLLAGVLGWPALTWRDRFSVFGLARALRASAEPPAAPRPRVRQWLRARPGAAAVRSALGAAGGRGAEPEHRHRRGDDVRRGRAAMLGPGPDDAALVLPARSLTHTFVEPAVAFLERHGGQVHAGAAARVVFDAGRAVGVEVKGDGRGARGDRRRALARAGGLCGDEPPEPLRDAIADASAMRSSPIVTANLWFDRPVLTQPFLGLPGRSFQWAFDRAR